MYTLTTISNFKLTLKKCGEFGGKKLMYPENSLQKDLIWHLKPLATQITALLSPTIFIVTRGAFRQDLDFITFLLAHLVRSVTLYGFTLVYCKLKDTANP